MVDIKLSEALKPIFGENVFNSIRPQNNWECCVYSYDENYSTCDSEVDLELYNINLNIISKSNINKLKHDTKIALRNSGFGITYITPIQEIDGVGALQVALSVKAYEKVVKIAPK